MNSYGDITSNPGMIGRLRAQQDYKAYRIILINVMIYQKIIRIIIVLLINIIIKI